MKIKLDENLPQRLCALLHSAGHEADTVQDERLTGRPDGDVWDAAQKAGALLMSQDLDFSDIRQFTPGSHGGVVLVRLKEPGREALYHRLKAVFTSEPLEQWRGCLVVVSDRKIRVRSRAGEGERRTES